MSKRARAVRDEIGDELQDLIDSAGALLEELKDQQGPAVESLRDRASATLKSATRHLSKLRPDVEELASRPLKHTLGFVRKDPWRAIDARACPAWSRRSDSCSTEKGKVNADLLAFFQS